LDAASVSIIKLISGRRPRVDMMWMHLGNCGFNIAIPTVQF